MLDYIFENIYQEATVPVSCPLICHAYFRNYKCISVWHYAYSPDHLGNTVTLTFTDIENMVHIMFCDNYSRLYYITSNITNFEGMTIDLSHQKPVTVERIIFSRCLQGIVIGDHM